MPSATLSIRVPLETRRWLERFAKKRGSAGMAATRILEEARRRDDFPAVEFRDTPLGRVPFVQGTRVQVAFVHAQLIANPKLSAADLAESFAWPHWKAVGVLAYLEAFPDECHREHLDFEEAASAAELKRILPALEHKQIPAA